MPDQPRSGRLDAETLAAYLDGQLPPEARAKVEAEIAADPESYEWAVNALRALEAPVPATHGPGTSRAAAHTLPFHRRRTVQAVVGALVATAAAAVLVVQVRPAWWLQLSGRSGDPRFGELVAAVGEERYVEGRLTGGFRYGPLRSATRGTGNQPRQSLALVAAAGELRKRAEGEPSTANLHAWGVAQVLLGDYDGAVASLEQAGQETGSGARIASDLSAAYLARFGISGRPADAAAALAAADRALASEPTLLEALFNRALALERLGEPRASAAWSVLANRPDDGAWSGEAQRHLQALGGRP